MKFLKPILGLSLNPAQSYGNLGSSNNGLAIQIISNDAHGKVSSLSSTTVSNKKNQKFLFYDHHMKIKTFNYADNEVKKIQKTTLQEASGMKYLITHRRLAIIFAFKFPKIDNNKFNSSGNTGSLIGNKIQVVKKSRYSQILEECQNKKVKFTDTEFQANDSSMGSKDYVINQKKYVGWKRISEIIKNPIFVKNFDPTDPIQGQMGNCYFLSSVATLTKDYPNLFEQIFASHKISEQGIYMARFYVQGILVEVVVDDYIPVNKKDLPLYAKVTQDNEIWPIILQKCWAKLFKSYQRIASGGSTQQVFYALTGSPYGIKIGDKLPIQKQKQEFIKLYKFQKKGSLFSCNTCKASNKEEKDVLQSKGLSSFHAYSVLQLIIDPICIVKLRNPWGFNKGSNPTNGYYYDWKQKLAEIYGLQNYDRIIEELKTKYNVDLFDSQKYGIFYMHYDEFMTYFQSITVCPIYNNLNLLTTRCVLFRNKPRFFYFDLTKPGKVIVSLSQMFKKLDKQFKDQAHPYTVTSLILARQLKRKSSSALRKISIAYSDSDLSLKLPQSLRISDKAGQTKNFSQASQSSFQDDETYYEFIAARSNNQFTPFNFVTVQEKIFQPGRYVIFVSANVKQSQIKKDFSITVYCEDSCFPKELTDLDELYPQNKPSSLLDSLKKIASENDIETKWLQQVLLDKVMKDPNEDRREIGDYTNEVKRKLSDEEFNKLENAKVSLQDSWFVFKTNSVLCYQKMGGYGYFVCHLSKTHPNVEYFTFSQQQFERRCIQFINSNGKTVKQNGNIRLQVHPGETKIIILKVNIPLESNQLTALQKKYPNYDFFSAPALPTKESISSSQKLSLGNGSQTALTNFSFFPSF